MEKEFNSVRIYLRRQNIPYTTKGDSITAHVADIQTNSTEDKVLSELYRIGAIDLDLPFIDLATSVANSSNELTFSEYLKINSTYVTEFRYIFTSYNSRVIVDVTVKDSKLLNLKVIYA